PSYLNEIENGKKYPKSDKILQLARALQVSYDDLVSLKLDQELNSLSALLESPVIRELPLQLFGLSQHDIVALLTRAPHEAGALIRTLLDIARSYDMHVEHFFHAMLRSYQEAHDNYFADIEQAARQFREQQGWPADQTLAAGLLQEALERVFGVTVDETTLNDHPELGGFRSVWVAGPPHLMLLNGHLSPAQKAFQIGREIGYQQMGLKERGITSSRAEASSFDQVLNDFKASYFAGALLIDEGRLQLELAGLFAQERWDGERFLRLMTTYDVSPEMFLYRLTQLIPRHFGLQQLHFLRLSSATGSDEYHLTKQFNMSRVPIPTGIALNEHYCRRWLSVEVLQDLERQQQQGPAQAPLIGVQRSQFLDDGGEFFCIALARPLVLTPGTNTSVTLGFRLNDQFRQAVRFWDDPAIPLRELNETCERCPLQDCRERAAPPRMHEQKQTQEQRKAALATLIATCRARLAPQPEARVLPAGKAARSAG
ncbi:MAG TPA: ImmA/IrrE family metallo-endopeptidase, partial [bacterium]|nr:ImmA/IrrE family metallo-endopeptidase [bacterium]